MTEHELYARHDRQFESNRFVYPVLSRRSGGISIGVNLNPDKVCNFDCIYCQVDRRSESEQQFVEQPQLLLELEDTLQRCVAGDVYQSAPLQSTPLPLRRLNDIAFSGDGEPTTYRNFDELMENCAAVKRRLGLDSVKMVLITNASMFHRPHVRRGLAVLDDNQGEIWAKLDAGSEDYYALVERTKIPLQQVLDNIQEASRVRPLVIQSLLMRIHDEPPSDEEISALIGRLQTILAGGGGLKLIQVYTVARRPAESFVTPLGNDELDQITARIRDETGVPAKAFYSGSPQL